MPCLVDGNGVQPTAVGALPPQLAALNRTFLNVCELTVRAALEGDRAHVRHAVLLDPNASATLSPEAISEMVDAMIEAHGDALPAGIRRDGPSPSPPRSGRGRACAARRPPGRALAAGIQPPVAARSLGIGGALRDGGTVRAQGLRWRPGRLPAGDRLLSFEVAYDGAPVRPSGGRCTLAAGTAATPFAARRYVVAHADTGRRLELVETATEVVETDPATFSFRVVRASRA